jgi:hypothetical protein
MLTDKWKSLCKLCDKTEQGNVLNMKLQLAMRVNLPTREEQVADHSPFYFNINPK